MKALRSLFILFLFLGHIFIVKVQEIRHCAELVYLLLEGVKGGLTHLGPLNLLTCLPRELVQSGRVQGTLTQMGWLYYVQVNSPRASET